MCMYFYSVSAAQINDYSAPDLYKVGGNNCVYHDVLIRSIMRRGQLTVGRF